MLPSIERIRSLGYDPDTGHIPGERQHTNGYMEVFIEGKYHRVHRVAWAAVTGAWPSLHIDHINHDRADNRWCNLREATNTQNMQNSRVTVKSKSGIKGVHWDKEKRKWGAWICINKRRTYIGRYERIEDAAAAYARAARENFGEFACI